MPDAVTLTVEHQSIDNECHRAAWLGTPDRPRVSLAGTLSCGVAARFPELLREWLALMGLVRDAAQGDVDALRAAAESDRRRAYRAAAPLN